MRAFIMIALILTSSFAYAGFPGSDPRIVIINKSSVVSSESEIVRKLVEAKLLHNHVILNQKILGSDETKVILDSDCADAVIEYSVKVGKLELEMTAKGYVLVHRSESLNDAEWERDLNYMREDSERWWDGYTRGVQADGGSGAKYYKMYPTKCRELDKPKKSRSWGGCD